MGGYVSTREAARRLGVSPATLRKYIREGLLLAGDYLQYVPGGSYRISAAALERLTAPAVPVAADDRREYICKQSAAQALRALGG